MGVRYISRGRDFLYLMDKNRLESVLFSVLSPAEMEEITYVKRMFGSSGENDAVGA